MKDLNKIIIITVILFSLFVVYGCTNKQHNVSQDPEIEAINDLIHEIEIINNTYPSINTETRGDWWHYILTAFVDGCAGLLVLQIPILQYQTLTCAILASNIFYERLPNVCSAESSPLRDDEVALTYIDNELWTGEGSRSGYLHNRVIFNLYETHGDEFFSLPEEEMALLVSEEVSLLTGEDADLLYAATIDNMSIINRCVELCNVDSTVEDYFISLKNEFPEKEQILSIYEPIIEGLQTANPVEDNGEYVTLIMSVIDNSSVQQSIKEDLKSGLTIANASARLWNTETIEKDELSNLQ